MPRETYEDPEDDPLKLVRVVEPDIGTIERNPDETVTYTPDPKKCDELVGTRYADGYIATIRYTIEDDNDKLKDSSVMTIDVKCIRVTINC